MTPLKSDLRDIFHLH